ncbi:DUF1868 domain-containing protein [Candidatus Riflebacteria bacterium]
MHECSKNYTPAVGSKFFPDGSVKAFAGNSLVSNLDSHLPQFDLLVGLQQRMQQKYFAEFFTFLPPDSFHMTVKDLLCDQVREPLSWSTKINPTLSFNEVEEEIIALLDGVKLEHKLNMKFDRFNLKKTVGPIIKPADFETEKLLSEFRDMVSDVTGIRHPTHDSYEFHISLAYILIKFNSKTSRDVDDFLMEEGEKLKKNFGILTLPPPALVFFPDMHNFPTTPLFGYKT